MKRILLFLIAVALIGVACQKGGTTAPAAAPAPTVGSANVQSEQVAVQLVKDWIDAIPRKDTARIDEVLADDFVAILPDGRKRSKAEHLEEITSGTYTPELFELSDTNARIFGDTAIVTYYQMEEGTADGRPAAGMMSAWTDVLAYRNGRWQVVAEHGSYFD
jgi:ketosteroid isomerase-like protein